MKSSPILAMLRISITVALAHGAYGSTQEIVSLLDSMHVTCSSNLHSITLHSSLCYIRIQSEIRDFPFSLSPCR